MLNIAKIKKCKLKPQYHRTLVRMAIIKRVTNNKCWREFRGKGTHAHCW